MTWTAWNAAGATAAAAASLLVLLAAVPAGGAGIEVGKETLLLPDGPGGGIQRHPDVAFGGGLYLVVWSEGWHGEGGRARIYAARVTPRGEVLDPAGIQVAPAEKGVQTRPTVAYGAGSFLVAWQDLRGGADYDVLAARVSIAGKVLDERPIPLAVGPGTQALPEVASDGKSFLAAWQGFDREKNRHLGRAAPVSAEGKVGEPVDTGAAPNPRLAWGGESYLAVYGKMRVACVRLDRQGRPIKPTRWNETVVRRARDPRYSLAARPGKGWLVVVHRSLPDYWGWGGPGAMRCYLVGPDGRRDPSLEAVARRDRGGNWSKLENWLDLGGRKRETWPFGQSACAFDGKEFVVVWPRHHVEKKVMLTNSDLLAARVAGWKPVDAEGVPVAAGSAEEREPVLASDGEGGLVAVYERAGAEGKVEVAFRTLTTWRRRQRR